jgi:hypothetical protein
VVRALDAMVICELDSHVTGLLHSRSIPPERPLHELREGTLLLCRVRQVRPCSLGVIPVAACAQRETETERENVCV